MNAVANEVAIQASLDHPGCVKVLSSFQDDSSYYLVLELCEKGELYKYFPYDSNQKPALPAELTKKKLIFKLLESLCYIHDKDVIHGDLKMGNILLDKEFNPKVADFGHASRLFSPSRKPLHAQVGSLYYQSPEQLRFTSGWLSPKIDCWSLGIVFYIFLEGSHPFVKPGEEIDADELLHRIENKPLKFKKTVNLKYVQLVNGLLRRISSTRTSAKDALKFLRDQESVRRQSSSREPKAMRSTTEGLSILSKGKYFEWDTKKICGSQKELDPWEKQLTDTAKSGEDGNRQFGSLASTQLTSALNGYSFGQSGVACSEKHSRSGLLKLSSVDGGMKFRKSDFSGNSTSSGIFNKVGTSTTINRFDPGHSKTMKSTYTQRFNLTIKEQLSSTSNLERLKSHKLLRTEGSLILDAKKDIEIEAQRSSKPKKMLCKVGVISEMDKKKLLAPFSSRSPCATKELNLRGTYLHSVFTNRSPSGRPEGPASWISGSVGISSPHFSLATDTKLVGTCLPSIDCSDLVQCKHEKKGYGDLVIEDGKVILDFWRRKIRVSIRGECVAVEQADSKKQMYSRKDLPKKFHSLYLFAAKMVDALRQKQITQSANMDAQERYSEARMSPEEIMGALSSTKGILHQ